MYQFPVVVESQYDLRGIYPPAQTYVKQILDELPEYIEKVFVFGSAVSLRWGTDSDLDFLFITDKPSQEVLKEMSPILRSIKICIDLIIKSSETLNTERSTSINSLGSEIEREGVCVYERPVSSC